MPHSFGHRARTRDLFSKEFRKHGMLPLQRYFMTYHLGEYVDIKGDGSVHKGMPHKYYHGKTGRIWNITRRALGVEVNKMVGNRYIKKRIHVRYEHVCPSRCREGFLQRMKENEKLKLEAKKTGVKAVTKRTPELPRAGHFVKNKKMVTVDLKPLPFSGIPV